MRMIVAALALALLLTNASAQRQPPDDADKRTSLDFRGADIDQVFEALFSGTGLNYRIEPDAREKIPPGGVTAWLKDLSFEEALTAVLRTYGLCYRIDEGVYVIEPRLHTPGSAADKALRPSFPGALFWPPHVGKQASIDLKDADVIEAVSTLFSAFELNYAIIPDVREQAAEFGLITVSEKDVPFGLAEKAILRPFHLSYRIEGGLYIIEPRPPSRAPISQRDRDGLTGFVSSVEEVVVEPSSGPADEAREGRTGCTVVTEYDDRGRMTKRSVINPDGTTSHREVYCHDADGHVTQKKQFVVCEYHGVTALRLDGRWLYAHDPMGNLTRQAHYDGNGTLISREVYTYEYNYRRNWTKKTILTWVTEPGVSRFEQTGEVHRTIMYHGDLPPHVPRAQLKPVQPADSSPGAPGGEGEGYQD